MTEYRRLSPANIRQGTRRPEVQQLQSLLRALGRYDGDVTGIADEKTIEAVHGFQVDHFGEDGADDVVGPITWTRLLEDGAAAGWEPVTMKLIQAAICFYETSTSRNAYGNTSLLDDGAGRNYGVLQHNSLGSLVALLKRAGRDDLVKLYREAGKEDLVPEVRDWMGSPEGIAAQDDYFGRTVYGIADEILAGLPGLRQAMQSAGLRYYQRLMLLLCDSVVQNGALWSPKRKPFWKSITPEESQVARYRELYHGTEWDALGLMTDCSPLTYQALKAHWYEVEREHGDEGRKEVNRLAMHTLLEKVPDPEHRLIIIAQWRARSSSPRWWRVVEARRMLDATGRGRVNGSRLSLYRDFGFSDNTGADA